jgi:hypothetical protein
VQATFKELYEHEKDGFLLRPTTDAPPELRDARDVNAALERCRADRWATPASDIARGELTEIEVELDAEDIFRVGAVIGSFLELFQEAPELLGPDVREQLQEALSVNAIINKLLAGLVPVRGQATDYMTVTTSDQEWVVHRTVLRQLGDDVAAQARALEALKRSGNGRASFSTRLASEKEVRASGTYSVARLTCSTAVSQLSGRKRQFVLGYVQTITAGKIELRPIVIAQRWLRPTPEIADSHQVDPVDPAHVWPSTVDQFAGVDFRQRLRKDDLNVLKDISETAIKSFFADILGEPDVPKDWGGEQFDLWTPSRLSVAGQPLRAAFAFKGPAKFRPMEIDDLGKNGDQTARRRLRLRRIDHRRLRQNVQTGRTPRVMRRET